MHHYHREGDNRSARSPSPSSEAETGLISARGRPIRRILGRVAAGVVGGSAVASAQHLGPELLGRPVLRWIVLYALLGGVAAGVWDAATSWTAAQLSLSREGTAIVSGLLAGLLLAGTVLLVSTLNLEVRADVHLLMRLSWKDVTKGFFVGAIGGGLWHFFLGPYPHVRREAFSPPESLLTRESPNTHSQGRRQASTSQTS